MVVFTVFAHGAHLAFGGSLAHAVSASTRAQAFEILVGNVRNLAAMQARRIAEQEIAFTIQAVGAVLVNHSTNDHPTKHYLGHCIV